MKKTINNSILLLCLAIILILASFYFSTNEVTYAEAQYQFKIKTEDGNTWQLLCSDNVILSESNKKWIDTSDESKSIDTIFTNAIQGIVGASTDYTVSFYFPNNLNISLKDGINKNKYTENDDSNIVVCVSGASIIGGVEGVSLEYRLESETSKDFKDYKTLTGQPNNMEFTFGSYDIGVEKYVIQGYFYEKFEFLGMEYKVKRISKDVVHCEILSNENPPRDEITSDQLAIAYGSNLDEIASSFNTQNGTYKLAQSEIDKNPNLGSFIPAASNEVKKYKFDYYPKNTNYLNVKDIELSLTIKKKDIEIFVDNVQRIASDETLDIESQTFKYHVRTTLPENVSIGDLGLSFYVTTLSGDEVQSIDCNAPSEYRIKAKFADTNYNAVSINATQNIISGGRFFVFPVGFNFELNGAQISVNRLEGFIDVDMEYEELEDLPSIEKALYDIEYNQNDYRVKSIYSLCFIEQSNFTITKYDQEFYLIITPSESTRFAIYKKDGSYTICESDSEVMIQYLAGEADDIIYLVFLEDIVIEESGIEWQHILMISLIGVLFVVFNIVIVIYKKRRWYLV